MKSSASWLRQAREKSCRIYVPSGAIAGLDGIKSASIGRIESALLSSRKPVAALIGSKQVVERNLPLDSFTEDTLIFEGLVEEAARAFPATSNVAASLRLAIDPATPVPVRVRIIAVPGGNENGREIRVRGEFGRIAFEDRECTTDRESPHFTARRVSRHRHTEKSHTTPARRDLIASAGVTIATHKTRRAAPKVEKRGDNERENVCVG